jgi:hypothetical protein
MLQLHALYIGTVIMIFSFIIAPKGNGDWRSQKLVRLSPTSEITTTTGTWRFGLGLLQHRGCRLQRASRRRYGADNDVTLKVITETPVLLTGSIYDTYNGKMVRLGKQGQLPFYSSLWAGEKKAAYSLDKPLAERMRTRSTENWLKG